MPAIPPQNCPGGSAEAVGVSKLMTPSPKGATTTAIISERKTFLIELLLRQGRAGRYVAGTGAKARRSGRGVASATALAGFELLDLEIQDRHVLLHHFLLGRARPYQASTLERRWR